MDELRIQKAVNFAFAIKNFWGKGWKRVRHW